MSIKWQDYTEEPKEVMTGRLVFKGTRVTVERVLLELGIGLNYAELLENYPAAKWLLEGPIQTSQLPECTMPCSTLRRLFSKERGLAFSKHSAVIVAFGRHFARTGKVPAEFHRFLLAAQDLRHSGDYGPPHAVTPDQAREQIAHADIPVPGRTPYRPSSSV